MSRPERLEGRFTLLGLTQQALVSDLRDVVGFQMHAEREAIPEAIKILGIQDLGVLHQGLLGRRHDPDLTATDILDDFGESLEVEDQLLTQGNKVAGFVEDEQDVLPPGAPAGQFDHLRGLRLDRHLGLQTHRREGRRGGELRRVKLMGDATGHRHGFDGSVHEFRPWAVFVRQYPRQEVLVFAITLETHLELRELTVSRIAQRLQDLMVENVADLLLRTTRELVGAEVDHQHVGIEITGDRIEQGLGGIVLKSLEQQLAKRLAADLTLAVEREPKVLGEGALTRAVETGDPDPDFLGLALLRQPHFLEQFLHALVNMLRYVILRNFRAERILVIATISDDAFDGAVDMTRTEKGANGGHSGT